jgi:S-formylglutathione hydrolase FrmB
VGRWADFLLDEMLPRLEDEFRLRRGAGHRAVFGKSSGGFGAIYHGLCHGEHWGAVACHSGDMGFEWCYLTEFPKTLAIIARHGGGYGDFLDKIEAMPKVKSEELHALMTLAMGATYDPDTEAPKGVSLPVDPHTCELDQQRWARWLEHDPLRLVERPKCRENLRRLKGIYLDCGSRDQYHLQYGHRAFIRRLEEAGIPHHYEEFDDDHSNVDYRMDQSLPFLYRALHG